MARPNSASAKRAASNRERAKKVQAANKARKTAALQRAKGSTKKVQQRRKTTTARVVKKTTPKKTPVKKTTPKKTTPKKSNVTNAAKKVAGKTKFGKAASLLSLIPIGFGTNALIKRDPTFGQAFKKARREKGPNSTFSYKGKKYSTVTQDQVKKAGHSTLRSYLNAGGKKKTSVKKPMKRKTGPRNRR